jgi:Anticodon binding domain
MALTKPSDSPVHAGADLDAIYKTRLQNQGEYRKRVWSILTQYFSRWIRDFTLQKLLYILVVGDKEVETGATSLRVRGEGDKGSMPSLPGRGRWSRASRPACSDDR